MLAGITCVLADDHPLLIQAMRVLLKRHGVQVVGEAQRGEEAVDLIRRLSPAVALVDVKLPDLSGIGVARRVSSENLDTAVLIYTGYGNAHLLSEALAAGAMGFVQKDAPVEEVLRAFQMVCEGRPYIEPSLAPAIVHRRGARPSLSAPEIRVLQLLAAGQTTEAIRAELATSVDAVQYLVQSLMRKLGAATRSEAVATALRAELIS